MRQERRSLRIAVRELRVRAGRGRRCCCAFRLARGCFATAVLRELVESLRASAPGLRLSAPAAARTRAPVPPSTGARGDVGEHRARAAQDRAHGHLEHRAAVTRAQTLAVDDPHAAHLLLEGADEKLAQRQLRLGDGESVQVDLALRRGTRRGAAAAAAAAERCGRWNTSSSPPASSGSRLRPSRLSLQHRGAVGAREARARARLRAAAGALARAQAACTPRTASRNSAPRSSALIVRGRSARPRQRPLTRSAPLAVLP